MKVSLKQIRKFQKDIWNFYEDHKREMPWRGEKNSYRVLVSEVMLQQTQVSRVVGKYEEFLKAFPTFQALAKASLGEVLTVWQGLGYNRRGRNLWLLARTVMSEHRGRLPRTPEELETLPGLGEATARSVATFAFNLPVAFIETNIRRVYIHHFFPTAKKVSDADILPLVEATIDKDNPREWYYALMDYGAYLKSTVPNPNRNSKHYTKQAKFEGSNREVRGAILKMLTTNSRQRTIEIRKALGFDKERFDVALAELVKEGFVKMRGTHIQLA